MPLPMFQKNEETVPRSHIHHVIAIAAGKGGVGKSSVTVNLAYALKGLGYKVGILDADIYGPSIRKMLPEESLPSQKGKFILPAICNGIPIISIAYFRKSHEATAVRAPIANSMISQFIQNVLWGSLDYLLIDFPPGTGDIQLTLCQQANLTAAIMVTTPQEVAILDVRKAMNLFDEVKVPILGILENMSYYIDPKTQEKHYLFGKEGGLRLAKEAAVPLLGSIPITPEISRSGDIGEPLGMKEWEKNHPIVKAFYDFAETIVCEVKRIKSQLNLQISQKTPYEVTIEWSDGMIQHLRFREIQKQCPCAECSEKLDESCNAKDVMAQRIVTVGKYALRFEFTSGCSAGIYSFDFLRHMERRKS